MPTGNICAANLINYNREKSHSGGAIPEEWQKGVDKRMKKLTVISIIMLTALMAVAGALAGSVGASAPDVAPVSGGLQIIAYQNAMGKYGVSGGEIAFSPDDFERSLNVRRIDHLTVTALPTESMGRLMLGGDAVKQGQTVSRENIHKLAYVPAGEGILEDSFEFTTGNGYKFKCAVYMLEGVNYAPTAAVAGELSLEVSTHRNVSIFGSLSGHDEDGDEIRFEIVSYPKNGLVMLTDPQNGEFRYTPKAEYVGKDSFKYVVIDKYGNYSAASEVSLNVSRVGMSEVLSDMGGSRAHSAAITVVEKGIMSAQRDPAGRLVFCPDEEVSREDFLVAVMKSVGIVPESAAACGFADDEDVSESARGYLALAKEKGYVSGTPVSSKRYFYPKSSITSAEAAVIIDNVIGGSRYVINDKGVLSVFSDESDVPAWAEKSMLTLKQVGVIGGNSGYLYPQKELTRENAAMLISAVIKLTDREMK